MMEILSIGYVISSLRRQLDPSELKVTKSILTGVELMPLLDTVFHVKYAGDNVIGRKVDFMGKF